MELSDFDIERILAWFSYTQGWGCDVLADRDLEARLWDELHDRWEKKHRA